MMHIFDGIIIALSCLVILMGLIRLSVYEGQERAEGGHWLINQSLFLAGFLWIVFHSPNWTIHFAAWIAALHLPILEMYKQNQSKKKGNVPVLGTRQVI